MHVFCLVSCLGYSYIVQPLQLLAQYSRSISAQLRIYLGMAAVLMSLWLIRALPLLMTMWMVDSQNGDLVSLYIQDCV